MLGMLGILVATVGSYMLWPKHRFLSLLLMGWAGVTIVCMLSVLLGAW